MQEQHIYEYAVIRVVPRVEREEFLNIGVILFCKREKFIKVLFEINEAKLRLFSNELDIEQVRLNIQAFATVAHGDKEGGPIGEFDLPSRFRWLTALRSSAIQTSRPHPGLCHDLYRTTQRLFEDLVL